VPQRLSRTGPQHRWALNWRSDTPACKLKLHIPRPVASRHAGSAQQRWMPGAIAYSRRGDAPQPTCMEHPRLQCSGPNLAWRTCRSGGQQTSHQRPGHGALPSIRTTQPLW